VSASAIRAENAGQRRVEAAGARAHTLGILWVVYAVWCVISAVWIVVYSQTLVLMFGAIVTRVPNPFEWMTFFHIALAVKVVLELITAVAALLAGFALVRVDLTRSGAGARNLAVVAGLLGLVNGPLGILVGVPTLVICLQDRKELR
jgi:hypothetical protein